MKKIVPFNNTLEFNTDIKEITAISLEHTISKDYDTISGVFYISGDYKITEGSIEKEPFNFELPFDIALSENYKEDTLVVDIDDFRYEIISDKKIKVNIDLYIDGEIEEPLEEDTLEEHAIVTEDERIDLLKDMLEEKENNMEPNININNQNIFETHNENEFDNNESNMVKEESEEKFVTYRLYKVLENDTLDSILTKYNITKEQLGDYNDIENIQPGDKLLIPTNEK